MEECFDVRKQQSTKLRTKYPNKLPIIIVPRNICISKTKYLVPYDITFSAFIQIIRNNIAINKNEAFFCLIDGILPKNTQSIIELYNIHNNKDGFLYIDLVVENTFG